MTGVVETGVLGAIVPHGWENERRGSAAGLAGVVVRLEIDLLDRGASVGTRLSGESCRCPLHGRAFKSSQWAEASGDLILFGLGLI